MIEKTMEETCLLRIMRLVAAGKGYLPWGEAMCRTRNAQGHSHHLIMKSMAKKGIVRYQTQPERVYLKDEKC